MTQNKQRHESRAARTYQAFLKSVCRTGVVKEEQAEVATLCVLSALRDRLPDQEAKHLEAQLPSKLRDRLHARATSAQHVARFGWPELVDRVAQALGLGHREAEEWTRTVLAAVRAQISEGEAEDVARILPADLSIVWRHPLGEYVPPHAS